MKRKYRHAESKTALMMIMEWTVAIDRTRSSTPRRQSYNHRLERNLLKLGRDQLAPWEEPRENCLVSGALGLVVENDDANGSIVVVCCNFYDFRIICK